VNIRHFHYFYTSQALRNVSGKVLDVGCGNGEISIKIQKENKSLDLVGCDSDRKRKPPFPVKYATATKLPYKSHTFDAVLMFDVLEHLKYPVKSLSEIKRVLKKGGVFHLVVPCEADLVTIDGWLKLIFKLNLKAAPIGHINQFTHAEILALLTKHGFKIKAVNYSYHFIYQFFSFLYYLYLHLFKKGGYQTVGRGDGAYSKFVKLLMDFSLKIVYFESKLFKNFKGQTAHITAVAG
jgi:ubiquinone/menaquinone biosynthesis C-methylase UbiE